MDYRHRHRVPGCMVITAAVLFLFACVHIDAAQQIEIAAVSYHSVDVEQLLDGVVEPVEQSTLAAEMVGRVTELNFDVGDSVRKGTVLLRFDAVERRARVTQEQAGRAEARARMSSAKAEYQRIKNLFEKKLLAQADMDRATAALETAEAAVQAAEARIQGTEEQMKRTAIAAPYSIVVTARHVELGETIQIGQPLLAGISVDKLRVSVLVPQSLRAAITKQSKAYLVWADAPAQRTAASTISVFPAADPQSHSYTVRLGMDTVPEHVYPGGMVKVAFVLGQERRLLIPLAAVVHRGEVTAAYVVAHDGRVSMRHIRTGRAQADGMMEVLAGLREGDSVALDPVQAGVLLKQQQAAVHE